MAPLSSILATVSSFYGTTEQHPGYGEQLLQHH